MGGYGSGIPGKPTALEDVRVGRLEDLDQRYRGPRQARSREREVADEMFGGLDRLTPIQRSLLRRWVHVEMLVSAMESAAVTGGRVELSSYVALVDRHHSLSKSLGVRPQLRPAGKLVEQLEAARERALAKDREAQARPRFPALPAPTNVASLTLR